MEPLKEMFNHRFYTGFAEAFGKADRNFNTESFIREVTKNLEDRSLNQRLHHTSVVLQHHLPADFKKAISVLYKAVEHVQTGYTALVFPGFVGMFGKEHFDLSMEALKHFTAYGSSEFAVREFLKLDMQKALKIMHNWAADGNHHVRRLASEGSRPRLPWSFKLDAVIKEPSLTRGILEQLNADTELYVRKSVANHLNDISKDHPDYMIRLVKGWNAGNTHTAWIIKHASRSLIKLGHQDSLAVFNFEKNVKVRLDKFRLGAAKIRLGEELLFSFDIVSEKKSAQKLVIDYAIHYRKAGGGLSRKVFKLKEAELAPGARLSLSKKQTLKDFTTRKHYAGEHKVDIIVNGSVMGEKTFVLAIPS
ncbi:DNA alkylation repair protein [Chitinophaga lutea]|uniref:DNA alkylation repair protein n=1 Tax=Chitinophaga lutea TaxID=2488634 RepID=A0A3N4PH75_9BACT|nr:DNA alkylation repair protein [Chitinophaga lutea]RPE08052.1 DNA alkylation repair protein [Chitinophaga lutea]